jgi:hypothetical protein
LSDSDWTDRLKDCESIVALWRLPPQPSPGCEETWTYPFESDDFAIVQCLLELFFDKIPVLGCGFQVTLAAELGSR